MALKIDDPHGAASEEQVRQLESQLGVPLPPAYRDFLLKIGGGYTPQVTVPKTDGMGLLLHIFDVVRVGRDHTPEERVGFPGYIPWSYLYIGGGAGGGLCVRIKGGDEGSVWWADFDKAGGIPEEEPHEEIMIRLSDDFDSFLALFE